jgi:RNA polymerase sigma-70 factor (ECF subfamily)
MREAGTKFMENNNMNALALDFQNGDLGSFKELVDSMTRPLIAMAYRYTQNWDSAQDLCQETWIKVYEKIHRYDSSRPFKTWLYAIHRNGCLSHLRKFPAWKYIDADDHEHELEDRNISDPDPLEIVEQKEFGARLREAMQHLSKRQQLVFATVDLEQIGQEEAALILEMNFSTLRATLHQARKRLAKMLRTTEERP